MATNTNNFGMPLRGIILTCAMITPALCFSQSASDSTSAQGPNNRVLVISGGGSRGAWGGGVAKQLVLQHNLNYRAIFGTSSGSLLAPMIALELLKPKSEQDFKKIESGFTQVNQKSVFSKNPFKKKNGEMRGFYTFWRLLWGKKNLGETYNLRDRIREFFKPEDYQRLRQTDQPDNLKTIVVSTVSITSNNLKFIYSDSIPDYETMVNWVWASANQPVFMTPVPMEGDEWIDGGVKENVPIREAILYARKQNIIDVDVIVLNTSGEHTEEWPPEGKKSKILSKIQRTISIFSDEIKVSDILTGILEAGMGEPINLRLFYMDENEFSIAPNSNFFKKENQEKLWNLGFMHSFENKSLPPVFQEILNNVTVEVYN